MVVKQVIRCATGFALFLSSCTTAVKPVTPTISPPAFVTWSQSGAPTKRLCVLPFTDPTATPGLAGLVRESFAGQLSVKRFVDVELYVIDAQLALVGEDWKNLSAQQIGKIVGCDALIFGEINNIDRLYLGIYSQLALQGTIRFVDTTTGQTMLTESYTTRFHAGGIPLSPLAIVPNAILNLGNMTDTQMVRVIDDFSRHLAEKVPDLPTTRPIQNAAAPSSISPAAPHPGEVSQASIEVTPEVTPNHYRVQVASFSSQREAQQAARLLREKGYHPAIAESTSPVGSWHSVLLGPFPSAQAADLVGRQIRKTLPFTPVVTHTLEQ
jgi:hypothetical protein